MSISVCNRVFKYILLLSFFALPGCATHPLPSDVTGLDVDVLVHKIQCEAADVVRQHYASNGFTQQMIDDLARLEKDIRANGKKATDTYKLLKDRSDFGISSLELIDAENSIKLEAAQLLQRVAALKEQAPGDVVDAKKHAIEIEMRRLQQEQLRLRATNKRLLDYQFILRKQERLLKQREREFADLIKFNNHKAVFAFQFLITEQTI